MKYEVKDLNAPSRWNMRIWDDDKKEWLCQSDKDALTYYGFDITGGETTEFQGLPKWHPDRHLIWEQSTGLKDKNGKEIYEGDIVRIVSAPFLEPHIGIVGFDGDRGVYDTYTIENNRAYWETGSCFCSLMGRIDYTTEVIGNIHENPELLEGK